MSFTDWWEQLTKAERKVIGESNAKFVWEECQKYTLMTIEEACKAQVAYDQGVKEGRERFEVHIGGYTLTPGVRPGMIWISDAGGVAVIAHPARYRFTANEEYALFSEFKAHGGRGVEVVTGSHSDAEALRYADVAKEFGLAASRGSDFHSPEESRTDLGLLPYLPGHLTPVWELVAHRIQ